MLPAWAAAGTGLVMVDEVTASLGIDAPLVTCDDDNLASRHTIERAGGHYESSHTGPDAPVPVRRCWFETDYGQRTSA